MSIRETISNADGRTLFVVICALGYILLAYFELAYDKVGDVTTALAVVLAAAATYYFKSKEEQA